MTNPGQCHLMTKAEQDANDAAAQYAYIGAPVLVTDTDGVSITFYAPDSSGNPVELKATWGDETVMWAPCPSSLPSQAVPGSPGSPPGAGATGVLYLRDTVLAAKGVEGTTPKWPKRLGGVDAAAGGFHNALKIWPTGIVVTGVELANGKFSIGSVNLLSNTRARAAQTVVATHAVVELELTADGVQGFSVVFNPFPFLPAAVEVIKGRVVPAELAEAWRIVAACVQQLPTVKATGTDTGEYVTLLRSVVPDLG